MIKKNLSGSPKPGKGGVGGAKAPEGILGLIVHHSVIKGQEKLQCHSFSFS